MDFHGVQNIMGRHAVQPGRGVISWSAKFPNGGNMLIKVTNLPSQQTAQFAEQIEQTFAEAGLATYFRASTLDASDKEITRGDPITIAAILLTAAAGGGALTVALGKDGFLTRLAHALEAVVNRRVDITVEANGKKVHVSGHAGLIERMLRRVM